jgi:hypothetical protein
MLTPVSLQHYRNRHKDRMAFLLGCGPSLAAVDTALLKPYVTMAVAEAIVKLPDPTYFFSCDGFLWLHGLFDAARNSPSTAIILGCAPGVAQQATRLDVHEGHLIARKWDLPPHMNNVPRLDDDRLVVGAVSSHPALHLLLVMGCDPIVLLGMDGGPIDGVHGFWMLPEYYAKAPAPLRAFYGEDPIAEHAKRHSDAENVLGGADELWAQLGAQSAASARIINASPASKITCFEKMDLKAVLDKYGGK